MVEEPEAFGVNLALHATVDDWQALRRRAVSFAAVTVTEGLNWLDENAVRQVTIAQRAGLHVGIRHYARAGAPAYQARYLVETGKPLGAFAPGALAPTLDVGANGIDDRFIKTWIKAWRHASGLQRVLVYADHDDWAHRFSPDKWADDEVVLWLVRRNGIPGRPGWFHSRLGVHQHGHTGGIGTDALVYPFALDDLLL